MFKSRHVIVTLLQPNITIIAYYFDGELDLELYRVLASFNLIVDVLNTVSMTT